MRKYVRKATVILSMAMALLMPRGRGKPVCCHNRRDGRFLFQRGHLQ